MGSAELLARFTRHFLERSTNIPIVQLEMAPETLQCKLLTAQGCSVYHDRPRACRMYPLDITGNEGAYRERKFNTLKLQKSLRPEQGIEG